MKNIRVMVVEDHELVREGVRAIFGDLPGVEIAGMPCAALLIVDDDADIRQQLKWGLASAPYRIHFAADANQAMKLFHAERPGVVTLDLGLPPHPEDAAQGFSCLTAMLAENPAAKIIVLTGSEDPGDARQAVELGAYDFFRKPIDLNELKVMIGRAFHIHAIERGRRVKPLDTPLHPSAIPGIIGQCEAMRGVFSIIRKVAVSDAPVLIRGESGTDKELVAQAIHRLSPRRKASMVCVNCGTIPENLLESEFFGHERGAFTGATNTVQGKVEYADKGTLFLDEIGELPVTLQVKLLRFLQEMTIQRVGGRTNIPVNVRVLTATNRNIRESIQRGQFRENLYYRIGVVTIELPPLRERGEDATLLARHFLSLHAPNAVTDFSPQALDLISSHPWPGNVRELENKIRRAVILAENSRIAPEDLALDAEDSTSGLLAPPKTLKDARSQLERQMVAQALKNCTGNIVKASQSLGISRPTFYELMRKHGIGSPR